MEDYDWRECQRDCDWDVYVMPNWLLKILALFGYKPRRVWSILNGVPVSYDVSNGAYFWFPNMKPGANYLLTPSGQINGPYVTIGYTIEAQGAVLFDYRTADNNMAGDGKGNVRLFIQRRGDDMSAVGNMQHYRWWSTAAVQELAPGSYVLTASLDPSQWTSVYGTRGSMVPDLFAAAMSDAESVGVTFGGGSFYGHGVFANGGAATFRVDSVYY